MADQWENAGGNPYGMDVVSSLLDVCAGIERVEVINTETGEYRDVDVHSGQTLGEAIANGQFIDKD